MLCYVMMIQHILKIIHLGAHLHIHMYVRMYLFLKIQIQYFELSSGQHRQTDGRPDTNTHLALCF